MANFYLNNQLLPIPQGFLREQLETASKNKTITGFTRKQITNRKERYIIEYKRLSQAQVAAILGIWNIGQVVDFEVNNGITITPTPVHIEIDRREYNTPGGDFREDIVLTLEEVS